MDLLESVCWRAVEEQRRTIIAPEIFHLLSCKFIETALAPSLEELREFAKQHWH